MRAYRRAADVLRDSAVPVAELVRTGRIREVRGIGPAIEARLRELVETGDLHELKELEERVSPDLVGVGRLLGLSAKRSMDIAQTLGVRTLDELREAAVARAASRGAGNRARRPSRSSGRRLRRICPARRHTRCC